MSIKPQNTGILVVDDDDFQLKVTRLMLKQLGYTSVVTCNDGLHAMRMFNDTNELPDIILLDLNMPGMDGIEFIRTLADYNYPGSIILMSGEDDRVQQTAERLIQVSRLNLLGRLQKPVSREILSNILSQQSVQKERLRQTNKASFSTDEVRNGIANQEFINYYQPKVDIATCKPVGVESLVRWNHPRAGIVFPDQFIYIAEENGLINDLTEVILKNALKQAGLWKREGIVMQIAVNVSMDNLTALDFPDRLVALVKESDIEPQSILLEVTESRLMRDTRAVFDILTRLRLKRFGLSIDDFGTGYSSLSQLRDLPFDELKIDRSFVHGAATNHTSRAIFDASLGLAKQLGMKTVAEGVEDLVDWQFLSQSGCDLAQGYFIARPMPPDEIRGWLDQWEKRARLELHFDD